MRYAMWRLDMWKAGFGSYRVIEHLIEQGLLVPCMRPEQQPITLEEAQKRGKAFEKEREE